MVEILLVEDNVGFGRALKMSIENQGHAVELADSLPSASQLMQQKLFQVLVSDTELFGTSDNLDGIEVAKQFRKMQPDGKIIGMSSIERPEWEGNCDIFLSKDGIAKKLMSILKDI